LDAPFLHTGLKGEVKLLERFMDVLPGMNAGVSIFATPSPSEGSRVAEEDVGRLGIEPSAAKAYPSPA
jgi:hypothetical protein